jgi:hypothetical protein
MAGDPLIKPLLDLGGQMKNFDSHGFSPCTCLGTANTAPGLTPQVSASTAI